MSENKIYVGNLSYDITKEALQECFEKFGSIGEVNLIRDRMTQKLKGFGFITFDEGNSVQQAIEMDGEELLGRPMKVSVAKEREPRSGGRNGKSNYGGRNSAWNNDNRGNC